MNDSGGVAAPVKGFRQSESRLEGLCCLCFGNKIGRVEIKLFIVPPRNAEQKKIVLFIPGSPYDKTLVVAQINGECICCLNCKETYHRKNDHQLFHKNPLCCVAVYFKCTAPKGFCQEGVQENRDEKTAALRIGLRQPFDVQLVQNLTRS